MWDQETARRVTNGHDQFLTRPGADFRLPEAMAGERRVFGIQRADL
jgi:hypothetical protein